MRDVSVVCLSCRISYVLLCFTHLLQQFYVFWLLLQQFESYPIVYIENIAAYDMLSRIQANFEQTSSKIRAKFEQNLRDLEKLEKI